MHRRPYHPRSRRGRSDSLGLQCSAASRGRTMPRSRARETHLMRPAAAVLALLAGLGGSIPQPGEALELTAITLFLCDEEGTVIPAGRWNSGPVDAAWDLFVHEGPQVAEGMKWLNGSDHTVRIPLEPGTRTFTFRCDAVEPPPLLGLNLFFDGKEERPGISARTKLKTGEAIPPFPTHGAAGPL